MAEASVEVVSKVVGRRRADLKKLANFRRNSVLLAEVPMNPLSDVPILSSVYDFVYYEGYRQSCLWNYEKLKNDKCF